MLILLHKSDDLCEGSGFWHLVNRNLVISNLMWKSTPTNPMDLYPMDTSDPNREYSAEVPDLWDKERVTLKNF